MATREQVRGDKMTDTPTPKPPDDGLVCRVHGIPCSDTTDCNCDECAEYRMTEYLAERNARLSAKMATLSRRYRNLPRSSVFYLDRRTLYIYLAERMLYTLCEKLELPPAYIRLRPDPRLAIPPDADVQVPSPWAQAHLGTAFTSTADQMEIRSMVQTYVRGFVTAAAEDFMRQWEQVLVDFGYIRRPDSDGAGSEATEPAN